MPLTMSALPSRAVSEVESMSRRNRISRAVSEVESISRRNRVPRQSSHGPVATRPRKRAARKIRVARQSSHGPAATRLRRRATRWMLRTFTRPLLVFLLPSTFRFHSAPNRFPTLPIRIPTLPIRSPLCPKPHSHSAYPLSTLPIRFPLCLNLPLNLPQSVSHSASIRFHSAPNCPKPSPHLHIFTSSHLHIFTSSPSHLHIFTFTCSHVTFGLTSVISLQPGVKRSR
jgi:hypothetical protein